MNKQIDRNEYAILKLTESIGQNMLILEGIDYLIGQSNRKGANKKRSYLFSKRNKIFFILSRMQDALTLEIKLTDYYYSKL